MQGLGQANAQQRAHGAVEHRHVKLQVIPTRGRLPIKVSSCSTAYRQRQALGES